MWRQEQALNGIQVHTGHHALIHTHIHTLVHSYWQFNVASPPTGMCQVGRNMMRTCTEIHRKPEVRNIPGTLELWGDNATMLQIFGHTVSLYVINTWLCCILFQPLAIIRDNDKYKNTIFSETPGFLYQPTSHCFTPFTKSLQPCNYNKTLKRKAQKASTRFTSVFIRCHVLDICLVKVLRHNSQKKRVMIRVQMWSTAGVINEYRGSDWFIPTAETVVHDQGHQQWLADLVAASHGNGSMPQQCKYWSPNTFLHWHMTLTIAD